MQSKTLVVLSAVAILGASSTAMAKGGGGGGGGGGKGGWSHGGMHGHVPFNNRFQRRFINNANLWNWGWGWGWGGGYGDSGYGNTTVVAFPQVKPQTPDVTGSVAGPCHWNTDTFTVPSSAGGTRPVQVVGCQ
jgi:hypothetical protein